MKTIKELYTESKVDDAEDEIRNMFTSERDYKDGVVPDADVKVIMKASGGWAKRFGAKVVKQAFNELVDDEYIKKDGKNWKWVG